MFDNDGHSPFPWRIGYEYEQEYPGLYILDANGIVIFSSDVEPSTADRDQIIAMLFGLAPSDQLEKVNYSPPLR